MSTWILTQSIWHLKFHGKTIGITDLLKKIYNSLHPRFLTKRNKSRFNPVYISQTNSLNFLVFANSIREKRLILAVLRKFNLHCFYNIARRYDKSHISNLIMLSTKISVSVNFRYLLFNYKLFAIIQYLPFDAIRQ